MKKQSDSKLEEKLQDIIDRELPRSSTHCERIFAAALIELLRRTSKPGEKP
jgi:hypothetical protein